MSDRENPYTPPRVRPQPTAGGVWPVLMVVALSVVSLTALAAAVAIAYAERFAGR